jgi:hypothetical protein
MPQDRESGDRARKWGYCMAQEVAKNLGAILINPKRSNEALLNDHRILIKSAHYGDPQIGATPATLDRVEAIVAALQDKGKEYTLYEVTSSWFKLNMSPSRSPRASHVMMVECAKIREEGKPLRRISASCG